MCPTRPLSQGGQNWKACVLHDHFHKVVKVQMYVSYTPLLQSGQSSKVCVLHGQCEKVVKIQKYVSYTTTGRSEIN